MERAAEKEELVREGGGWLSGWLVGLGGFYSSHPLVLGSSHKKVDLDLKHPGFWSVWILPFWMQGARSFEHPQLPMEAKREAAPCQDGVLEECVVAPCL